MIVVCFDGSPDAEAAIDRAGELFPGRPATVLTVWETFTEILARSSGPGLGYGAVLAEAHEIDAAAEKAASELAEQGAERARRAGLDAKPRTVMRGVSIADTILTVADEVDASAIVVGTRGRGGIKSLVLGSVSNAVVHQADRPVVIVPGPTLVAERAARRG